MSAYETDDCFRCGVQPELSRRSPASAATEQATCPVCGQSAGLASELEPKSFSTHDCLEVARLDWNLQQRHRKSARTIFSSLRGEAI